MNKALVSIIIPIYNQEKLLANCIESIVNQTYKNIEVILVDDGSTDSSREICKEYEKKYNFVKLICKGKNEGVVRARKSGVDFCTGEYIMFVDSDDIAMPNMVESLIEENKDSKYDLIIFNFESEVKPGCYNYFEIPEFSGSMTAFYDNIYEFYKAIFLTYVFNKLYKASYLKNNDESFKHEYKIAEDLQLNLGYFEKCKTIKVINKILYTYNSINENSSSKKCFAQYYDQQFSIHKIFEKFLEKHCNLRENPKLQRMFFGDTRGKLFVTSKIYVAAENLTLDEKYEFLKYIVNEQKDNDAFKEENCNDNKDDKRYGLIIRNNQWLSFYDFIKKRI